MMEEFKLAEICDLDEITSLCEEVKKTFHLWNEFYPVYDDFYEDFKNNRLFIYKVDGKIIASLGLEESIINKDTLSLHMFMVDPSFQRKGYGKKIFFLVEEEMAKRGIKKLDLLVRNDHPFSLEVYQRWGYVSIGRVEVPWQENDTFYICLLKDL